MPGQPPRFQPVRSLTRLPLVLPALQLIGRLGGAVFGSHADLAHAAMPGARPEIFEDSAISRSTTTRTISSRWWAGSVGTRVAVLDALGADERSAT